MDANYLWIAAGVASEIPLIPNNTVHSSQAPRLALVGFKFLLKMESWPSHYWVDLVFTIILLPLRCVKGLEAQ